MWGRQEQWLAGGLEDLDLPVPRKFNRMVFDSSKACKEPDSRAGCVSGSWTSLSITYRKPMGRIQERGTQHLWGYSSSASSGDVTYLDLAHCTHSTELKP